VPPRHRVVKQCVVCGANFEAIWHRRETMKTCSKGCLKIHRSTLLTGNKRAVGHAPNSTSFKSGLTPWNKGTKGVMQPNSGSFQIGRESETKQPIGATTTRKDKTGNWRAWVKVDDKGDPYDWMLRAVLFWETAHGPVLTGMIIHHKDRNTLNNSLYNLELMSRVEHINEHRHELRSNS